jgi:hypothetical protein
LDKRRSATAIAIFCKWFSQKPHHLWFYSSGTTDSKCIELSLGVHTAMNFPWGGWNVERGRGRKEGRRPSLVDERRRPVVVGSWGGIGSDAWTMDIMDEWWRQQMTTKSNLSPQSHGHHLSTLLLFILFFCFFVWLP